jgi:hypothetical protein
MKRAGKCLTEQRIREFTRGLIISVDMQTVEVLAFRLLGWTFQRHRACKRGEPK